MRRISGDVWMAIFVIVLATVYLWMDSRIPVSRLSDSLGPRAFPALVGGGLLLGAVLLLVETRAKRGRDEPAVELSGAPEPEKRHNAILFGMVVWTAIYYSCLEEVGYLVSTTVFLLALLSYFHRGRHKTNLAIALIFTLVFDALFTYALGVPLPAGILSIST